MVREMLEGTYFNTIDAKNRAFIPTKLRYGLSERVYLVKGIDRCLYLFAPESWQSFLDVYINNRTLEDKDARTLKRFFLGSSREIELDSHGRITLTADHIEYAGIEKEIVVVGMGDMAEVWSKENYDKTMAPDTLDVNELMRSAAHARPSGQGQENVPGKDRQGC
jgi:MraZ protein